MSNANGNTLAPRYFSAAIVCGTCARPLGELRNVPEAELFEASMIASAKAFCEGHTRNANLDFRWAPSMIAALPISPETRAAIAAIQGTNNPHTLRIDLEKPESARGGLLTPNATGEDQHGRGEREPMPEGFAPFVAPDAIEVVEAIRASREGHEDGRPSEPPPPFDSSAVVVENVDEQVTRAIANGAP